MPMSPRLLRPIAVGLHPEAQKWRSAAIANGGTVSDTTFAAVSDFCRAIDVAGIRSKFYRLNLFAGTGLAAALTPLYLNNSRSGVALGNATDTNAGNLFVSGDYAESTGLTAGSTKYLDTGLKPDDMPLSAVQAMHLSVSHGPVPSANLDPRPVGTASSVDRHFLTLSVRSAAAGSLLAVLGKTTSLNSANLPSGAQVSASWVGSRTSATSLVIYKNGASDATLTTSITNIASYDKPFYVCRINNNGTVFGDGHAVPYRHYSIGAGLTGAEVTSYENALAAFRTALGRTA